MLWNDITSLAATQHGLVTRAQVLERGGTDEWLRWAVLDGRLLRIRRGVYAVRGASSEFQPLMAASLAAGPSAAASHLAAAALWGADQVMPGALEIATFDNRHVWLDGVRVHRSRLDATSAITRRRNIPVTVPPLTVVQLAETCHPRLVTSVANDLVKRNWTTFRAIRQWCDRLGVRSHNQQLRDMCERAIDLGGHADSPAARLLGEKLKAAGAPPFEMDYSVETPGGLFRIDFAWPGPKVGIEYNGMRDHDHLAARGADARRRGYLAATGWLIFDANSALSYAEVIQWVLSATAIRTQVTAPPTEPTATGTPADSTRTSATATRTEPTAIRTQPTAPRTEPTATRIQAAATRTRAVAEG